MYNMKKKQKLKKHQCIFTPIWVHVLFATSGKTVFLSVAGEDYRQCLLSSQNGVVAWKQRSGLGPKIRFIRLGS